MSFPQYCSRTLIKTQVLAKEIFTEVSLAKQTVFFFMKGLSGLSLWSYIINILRYRVCPFIHWVDLNVKVVYLVLLSVSYIGGLCCLWFLLLLHSRPRCQTIAVSFQYTHDLYLPIGEILLHSWHFPSVYKVTTINVMWFLL